MTKHIPHDGPLKWYAAGMSPARRLALEQLSAASQYAWIQMADPAMRAEYQGNARTKKSAYALAVADFLNPPQIRSVSLEQYTGQPGDPITLKVVDDFKVAGVRIELLDSDGLLVEEGEASEQGSTTWRYTTRRAVPPRQRLSLRVTAFDMPGNCDQQTIHFEL